MIPSVPDEYCEEGTVVATRPGEALVEAGTHGPCDSCESKHSCAVDSATGTRRIWMDNTLEAAEGDRVRFLIRPEAVVVSAFFLYLFPVAGLVAGVVAGIRLGPAAGIEGDLAGAGLGILIMSACFVILRALSAFFRKRTVFKPAMIRLVSGNRCL